MLAVYWRAWASRLNCRSKDIEPQENQYLKQLLEIIALQQVADLTYDQKALKRAILQHLGSGCNILNPFHLH